MSGIFDITVSVTPTTITPQRADFGTLAIVSHNASWIERSRTYGSAAAVLADFAVDSPEYLEASKVFSQTVAPKTVKIVRAALKPTQQYTIGEAALRNSDSASYKINVLGQGVTPTTAAYTSDANATAPEIHNGLLTSLNAVTGKNYLATFAPLPTFTTHTFTAAANVVTDNAHGFSTGDGPFELTSTGTLPTGLSLATDYFVIKIDANTYNLATSLANALAGTFVTISSAGSGTHSINADTTLSPALPFLVTGSAPGNWFSLELVDVTALNIAQTHADPGIATDLAAIQLFDSAWFTFITLYNSKALVMAAAGWAETLDKGYFPQVNETTAINTAAGSGGSGDTGDALKALNYSHTVPIYYPSPAGCFDGAWNGRVLPIPAGSESWDAKPITGVAAVTFTDTQMANLRGRRMNSVFLQAGLTITFTGITSSGFFFDRIRGLAWWKDDLSTSLLATKVASDKVEFEDSGIARFEATTRSSTQRAIQRKIVAKDPAPIFTFPKSADVSPTDRANRVLNVPNAVNAQLSGAIQSLSVNINVAD